MFRTMYQGNLSILGALRLDGSLTNWQVSLSSACAARVVQYIIISLMIFTASLANIEIVSCI